jgi:hypothetical protein
VLVDDVSTDALTRLLLYTAQTFHNIAVVTDSTAYSNKQRTLCEFEDTSTYNLQHVYLYMEDDPSIDCQHVHSSDHA